mgnify:CR=1 FL=1
MRLLRTKLTIQMYKYALFERLKTQTTTNKIQCLVHQLYTQEQTKIALSMKSTYSLKTF